MRRKFDLLRFIPAVVWMYVIYRLSDKPATESTAQSETLTLRLVRFFAPLTDMDSSGQREAAMLLEPYVREAAHAAEYAILFIAVVIAVSAFISDDLKASLISICICFLYSCTDEWHQLHVQGRSAELVDILLDTAGAFIAMIIYNIWRRHLKGRRKAVHTEQSDE
ncbi:MAG: VanZ family protein [Lachnospiraceae bacterium]|nr:VanZ family protein [Lachnospiraceae bacterium]